MTIQSLAGRCARDRPRGRAYGAVRRRPLTHDAAPVATRAGGAVATAEERLESRTLGGLVYR